MSSEKDSTESESDKEKSDDPESEEDNQSKASKEESDKDDEEVDKPDESVEHKSTHSDNETSTDGEEKDDDAPVYENEDDSADESKSQQIEPEENDALAIIEAEKSVHQVDYWSIVHNMIQDQDSYAIKCFCENIQSLLANCPKYTSDSIASSTATPSEKTVFAAAVELRSYLRGGFAVTNSHNETLLADPIADFGENLYPVIAENLQSHPEFLKFLQIFLGMDSDLPELHQLVCLSVEHYEKVFAVLSLAVAGKQTLSPNSIRYVAKCKSMRVPVPDDILFAAITDPTLYNMFLAVEFALQHALCVQRNLALHTENYSNTEMFESARNMITQTREFLRGVDAMCYVGSEKSHFMSVTRHVTKKHHGHRKKDQHHKDK